MENQEFTRLRNPVEYLKVFFRRKWLFITPLFLGLVIGIIACFVLPPKYESATVILVEEEKIINPLIQGLAISTSVADRMRTLKEQIMGWNSLVSLTKKLNLAKDVKSQWEFEQLILGLRRNINVQMRVPNLIKIFYYGSNPAETQLITKTLTDNLVEENMRSQTKETDVAIEFITEQLELYKRKIKESELADLQDQLKKLLVDSTEQHPLVREIRQKIDIVKKELESGDYKVAATPISTENPTYKALKQELDKLTNKDLAVAAGSNAYAANANEPNDPNASIYKLMLMDKLDSAQARDKNVNEMIYNMLLQKLETAKITQRLEVSKQGTRYTIIDPPRLPLRPISPNKVVVMLVGLVMGGFGGAGLVLGREFMDHSFLDIEDAKENLDLPILGAISRLTTQEEIDKEKYLKRKWVTIVAVSSVVLIFIVMLTSFFKR
ncbi:MAG: GNVR domain-containing protein [Candidatus Omnitrophota bacterium]|nr:GNVR domain-containing protein [Candidatus Omnitrophota bacterium]